MFVVTSDHHHLDHHRHHHTVVHYVVQQGKHAVNTSVLDMVAHGINACDCESTSSILLKYVV